MFSKAIQYLKTFFNKKEKVDSKQDHGYGYGNIHPKDSYSTLYDRVKLLESRLDDLENVILG